MSFPDGACGGALRSGERAEHDVRSVLPLAPLAIVEVIDDYIVPETHSQQHAILWIFLDEQRDPTALVLGRGLHHTAVRADTFKKN